MARIFISYRRTDTSGHAELLAHHLEDHYPGEIFFDRIKLEDGDRWDKEILAQLNEAECLLVVIGNGWLLAQDKESGMRRLDDPKDWVRREVQTGLRKGIMIVPVLMGDSTMPKDQHLPKAIRSLAKHEPRTIGKESKQDVSNLAEVLVSKIGPSKGKERQRIDDPTAYFRKLYAETSHIDIKGVEGANKAHSFRIDELYTPLTTVLAGQERKHGEEMAGQNRVPLQQALKDPRVLLIGNPGAGKSTFVKRIVFAACQTLLNEKAGAAEEMLGPGPCPFPIRIAASSLSKFLDTHEGKRPPDEWSAEWLVLYLGEQARGKNWGLDGEYFRARLNQSLLLLDGLDEVPGDTRRKNVARMAAEAAIAYDGARVVATSRPSVYGGVVEISGFHRVDIGDLDSPAIETFLKNWARAVSKGDTSADDELRRQLHEAIDSNPDIETMAANPVMLTTLAVLHWNRNRLPDKRAELYEAVLKGLSEAREQKDGRLSPPQCLEMFRHLAFAMHSQKKGKQVEIGPYDAAKAIAAQFRHRKKAEQQAAAEAFLQCEETDSGIVISRGNSLCFWHQTFQEFLAAQALAGRDEDRERILFGRDGKLHSPDWRETVQLLACVMWKQGISRIDGFLERILDTVNGKATLAERARRVGLMGRMLRDLKSWGYEIKDPRYDDHLRAVLAVFEKGCKLDFQTRLDAADALGQAGDPRLDRDNWIPVEGGSFWMGAQKTDPNGRNFDQEAHENEAPVRQVDVKSFRIARYPLTVQEYGRFVESGGYQAERYWVAGGFGRWTGPERWQQQIRFPSRPVVSVSWYEASAYCAWQGVRLPSEAEWEYAARCGREGVRYPWGNETPDETRASFDGRTDGATPVGLYPEGDTPSGICDLSGNVWEWMAQDYDDSQKVLRGGAWGNYPRVLRVSCRYWLGPDERYDFIGFRCARE